jgi:hypothetical protein
MYQVLDGGPSLDPSTASVLDSQPRRSSGRWPALAAVPDALSPVATSVAAPQLPLGRNGGALLPPKLEHFVRRPSRSRAAAFLDRDAGRRDKRGREREHGRVAWVLKEAPRTST